MQKLETTLLSSAEKPHREFGAPDDVAQLGASTDATEQFGVDTPQAEAKR